MHDLSDSNKNREQIITILMNFLEKNQWSMNASGELEGTLVPFEIIEEKLLDDLMHILACYQPGGGDYLYDQKDLEKEIRFVIENINQK